MNSLLSSFATNEYINRPGQLDQLGQIPDIIFTGKYKNNGWKFDEE